MTRQKLACYLAFCTGGLAAHLVVKHFSDKANDAHEKRMQKLVAHTEAMKVAVKELQALDDNVERKLAAAKFWEQILLEDENE